MKELPEGASARGLGGGAGSMPNEVTVAPGHELSRISHLYEYVDAVADAVALTGAVVLPGWHALPRGNRGAARCRRRRPTRSRRAGSACDGCGGGDSSDREWWGGLSRENGSARSQRGPPSSWASGQNAAVLKRF